MQRAVAARERRVRLRRHERRPRHRLDAAGDEEVAVARDDGVAGADDRGQTRGAEPVDRHAGDRFRQAGEQRGEPRDVAVVLAGLVGAAEPDVLDLAGVDAGALDGRGDRGGGQVVRTDAGEPAAVAADRRADGREDHGARHVEPLRPRGRSSRYSSSKSRDRHGFATGQLPVVVADDVGLAAGDTVVEGDPGLDRPLGSPDRTAVGNPLLAFERLVAVRITAHVRRERGQLREAHSVRRRDRDDLAIVVPGLREQDRDRLSELRPVGEADAPVAARARDPAVGIEPARDLVAVHPVPHRGEGTVDSANIASVTPCERPWTKDASGPAARKER